MFTIMKESAGPVVGIRAAGRLTDKDYRETLIPALEARFREHGKLSLLIAFDPDFAGWDLEAMWDDAVFGLRHMADFERLAVVGGPEWVRVAVRLFSFLMKGEIRTFEADAIDDAWAWVRGAAQQAA
ncbi:MAG: STAS/SEC14 domain-containing protein [Rhodothalassiaceae bacterium]